MEALKNCGFWEEFTYQEENIPNDKILYINKENKKYSKKKKTEKEKLYGLTPSFLD